MRNTGAKEIGPLIAAGGHQKATVRSALDDQLFTTRVIIIHQIFASSNEVIKDVLLVQQATTVMPLLTVFTAKADEIIVS